MGMPVFLIFMRFMNIELDTQPLFHKVLIDKPTRKLNAVFKGDFFIIRKSKDKLLLNLAVFPFFTAFNFIPKHGAILEFLIYPFRQQNLMMNISAAIFKGEKLPRPVTSNGLPLVIGSLPAGITAGASFDVFTTRKLNIHNQL